MDKKIVQQVILETLDAVNDQVKMITGYNGKIPWIEIDITKDYLRTLYENVLVLERYNVNESDFEDSGENEIRDENQENQKPDEMIFQPLEKKKEEKEEVKETPAEEIAEEIPEEEPIESTDKAPEEEEAAEQEKETEPEPEKEPLPENPEPLPEIQEKIIKKEPVTEDKEPENQKPENPEPKKEETEEKPIDENTQKPTEKGSTVGEKLGVEKKSLGEVIQKDEGSLNENMGKKPIRKLKSAIGINDKFFFVNELFHGVLKDYNDAITSLDSAVGREAAVELLGNLQKKHDWDIKGEGFKKLEDFVNRKF
jgi:hypothetical protein